MEDLYFGEGPSSLVLLLWVVTLIKAEAQPLFLLSFFFVCCIIEFNIHAAEWGGTGNSLKILLA